MDRDPLRLLQGFTFRLASGDCLPSALALQRSVYLADLGHIPNDGLDSSACHLLAENSAGAAVASCRIIGPQSRPFDIETFVDLSRLLGPGRTPAVIGRLVVRPDYRTIRRVSFLQLGLLKLAYTYAIRQAITDFLLYTYPSLLTFYKGAFFKDTDITFKHPDWGDVHLMRMDIALLPERCRESRTTVAAFLTAPPPPNFIV